MKSIFLTTALTIFSLTNKVVAQEMPQNQVPSVIVNNFQKQFPKAFDVEWELKGNLYQVEYEIGALGADHESWYNQTGKLVQHKEEISKKDLPQKVLSSIDKSFSLYRIDDVKKITETNNVTYTLELKSFTEEWKVAYDNNGKLLSKIAD